MYETTASEPVRRRPFGLPFLAIIGLALLAVPRLVLHDLGLIHEGTFVNLVLVIAPIVVWILVVVLAKVPNAFLTVLMIGVCYGVFLAIGHQLLWGIVFADNPAVHPFIIRVFAVISSLGTGVVVGAVAGLVAWGISAVAWRGRTPSNGTRS